MSPKQAKRIAQSTPVLTNDIILEIFLRLPVESLLRCKSVCKLWLSLISDPFFIKSHLNRSSSLTTNNAHRRVIFTEGDGRNIKSRPLNDVLFEKSVVNSLNHVPPSYSHQLYDPNMCHTIVGSCDGLVCIVGFHLKVDILFIWNPSTRISTTFVAPPSWRCKRAYGFAYDKATDDYKVVSVYRSDRYQAINGKKVKIYSLKTRNWKRIGDFPHGYPVNVSGVFSNGYLHWTATRRGATRLNYPCTIVSLDLTNETYGEVSQPVYDEDDKVLTLGALGEWLCVFCNYRLVTRADVWVMKVYGVQDSWTKLVSVSYPFNLDSPHYMPFFISDDGTILLQSKWDLVVCYSNDGSSSKIENFDQCDDATTFVESLVSPYPPGPISQSRLLITKINDGAS